jgi:peroxiredoxin
LKNLFLFLVLFLCLSSITFAGDTEYTGTFNPDLVADKEDLDQVIFRPVNLSRVKLEVPLENGQSATAGRLYHAPSDKSSILAVLVQPEEEDPFIYADLNLDGALTKDERFTFHRKEENNPYIFELTLNVPLSGSIFRTVPLFLQYLKGVQWDELKEGERLIEQSKNCYARGTVDIKGRKTLVEYTFNAQSKKVSTTIGKLGIDINNDGEIETGRFSPESIDAREENFVFHVGDTYVSTKRADPGKNSIVMRDHPASDFKRLELSIGSEMPDFTFTDFKGKKRKLSEFRGKYVLLDFWAAWCGPCRREMPYQKAAYSRFQARGFEILGIDNDPEPGQVRDWLTRNSLTWTQATMESVKDLETRLRIHLFPTTLLLDPEGRVISLNEDKKDQPQLRGRDLLRSLDQLLPP